MPAKIHYEQHRAALTIADIQELLEKHPKSIPVIVTSSGIAFSIKRISVTQVDSEFSKKVEPAIRFHI